MTAFGAGSSVASTRARVFAHHFTMGADFVLFGWLIVQAGTTVWKRPRRTALRRWGPLIVIALGCALVLLDPVRHVLLDHDGVFFEPQRLAMYAEDGSLTRIGKFCQVVTILGICLLVVGTVWLVDLPQRLASAACAGQRRRAAEEA